MGWSPRLWGAMMRDRTDLFCPVASRDDLPSREFMQLYDHWDTLRNGDVPSCDHVQPSKLPYDLLPRITLLGVEDGGRRIEVRLCGSELGRRSGVDTTGWVLPRAGGAGTDVQAERMRVRRMQWCIANRKPYCAGGWSEWSKHEMLAHRVLVLPYCDANNVVNRLLMLTEFEMGTHPCMTCPKADCRIPISS